MATSDRPARHDDRLGSQVLVHQPPAAASPDETALEISPGTGTLLLRSLQIIKESTLAWGSPVPGELRRPFAIFKASA